MRRKAEASLLQVWRKSPGSTLLLLLGISILGGCDPGFWFRPQGWEEKGQGTSVKTVHWIRFETTAIKGIVGTRHVGADFQVRNGNREPLVLDAAEMWAEGRTFPAQLPDQGTLEWRTVAPEASGKLSMFWSFEKSAEQELGASPTLLLHLRVGEQRLPLAVQYKHFR